MRRSLHVAAGLVIACGIVACRETPENAMRAFYANDLPECTLEDPLWTAGPDIVPLVLTDLEDRDMPRRRYAISFLGNIGDRRALGVLQRIVDDPTEIVYFRADALEAVYKIDPDLGATLARAHDSADELLGESAAMILQGHEFEKYGFWDRMLGRRCR